MPNRRFWRRSSHPPRREAAHKWPMRLILNGIFYVLKSGCPWRLLPREFPPWSTVHHYFRRWRMDGTFEQIHAVLREQNRRRLGRNPQPSGCIVGSQSVKTTGLGGECGYDGAEKLLGRKRLPLVDTLGLILAGLRARVYAADLQDRAAVPLLLESMGQDYPRLEQVCVEQGCTGAGRDWVEQPLGWEVTVVPHPPKPRGQGRPVGDLTDRAHLSFEWVRLPPVRTGFRGVLPRRWVAERTFAWLGDSRRLSNDYERLCETIETLIYASMARLMLRRLARA